MATPSSFKISRIIIHICLLSMEQFLICYTSLFNKNKAAVRNTCKITKGCIFGRNHVVIKFNTVGCRFATVHFY
jgi:hypothetical protein